MSRFALLLLVACSSSQKPPQGDDGWKVQLEPDAAVDASDAGPVEAITTTKREPGKGVKGEYRCMQLIGCGCDYGCQMGFWEEDGWHVNYRDAGTIAVIEQRCNADGKGCRDVWIRDVCQTSCPTPTPLASCYMNRDTSVTCEKQLR